MYVRALGQGARNSTTTTTTLGKKISKPCLCPPSKACRCRKSPRPYIPWRKPTRKTASACSAAGAAVVALIHLIMLDRELEREEAVPEPRRPHDLERKLRPDLRLQLPEASAPSQSALSGRTFPKTSLRVTWSSLRARSAEPPTACRRNSLRYSRWCT